ncbi:MAG: cytochrome c [Actinomycetota bacterium]|nr:cytochrome c [Actinomycetota bacterium]
MSDQLTAAAAALGIPESLVQRSAAARAAETGASVDEIIAAWAGGAPAPAAQASTEATPAATAAPVEAAPVEAAPVEAAPAVAQPADVVAAPAAAAQATTRAPIPDEVTPSEAAHLPDVITVPTVGIRERTNFIIPKWLTGALLFVPLFALFALGGATTGECGEATELSTDVISGEIVNCDGSAFTGQQIGGGGIDFIALGEEVYAGSAVTGVNCAGCHGGSGQGVGNFPALTGVMTTFGACEDHIEWVDLGSSGFQAAGITTYGDTAKAVAGGMPGHSSSLTPDQIAAVSAFERVRFGGGGEETVLADCGLAEDTAETEGGEEAEALAGS